MLAFVDSIHLNHGVLDFNVETSVFRDVFEGIRQSRERPQVGGFIAFTSDFDDFSGRGLLDDILDVAKLKEAKLIQIQILDCDDVRINGGFDMALFSHGNENIEIMENHWEFILRQLNIKFNVICAPVRRFLESAEGVLPSHGAFGVWWSEIQNIYKFQFDTFQPNLL